MKRLSPILVLLSLLLSSPVLFAQQKKNKEDEKFWKTKAKMYAKRPLALKATIENYENQIKDLKNHVKELEEHLGSGSMQVAGESDLTDSLRWAVIQLEGELQDQKNQYRKLEEAYKTQRHVSDMGISTGLVYRVQIGAYVLHEPELPQTTDNNFHMERSDGFNKYAIGFFRTYDEAAVMRHEVQKMGIEDAFVVAYIDGMRVSIKEASQYRENEGTTFLDK